MTMKKTFKSYYATLFIYGEMIDKLNMEELINKKFY